MVKGASFVAQTDKLSNTDRAVECVQTEGRLVGAKDGG